MTSSITLYRHPISGHSHRAQLFLSLLDLPFQSVEVDVIKGENRQPAFLAKNALGELPVLEDGDITIPDSNAILVYLALRYDSSGQWYPRDPLRAASVQRWLSLAAGHLSLGPGTLRLANLFRREIDRKQPEASAAKLFALIESTTESSPFLLGSEPTIADVALYTYTAHAPEGGLSLEPYPALRAWLARVEALAGFVPMQKVPAP